MAAVADTLSAAMSRRTLCAVVWTLLAATNAAAFSFHAAAITPALSLLTWSAPSPSRWLSLSLHPRSTSQLSLPPDAPSHLIVTGALDVADAVSSFTLCERDSDSRPNRPSSPSPLCAHATLPRSSSSSVPMDGSAAPRWDLDGARLSAELTRGPVDSSAHRISWSAARVSSDPAAPPLLYSLFAEWSAHTIDAKQMSSAADSTASPQPTLQRHSVRMCSVRSADQQSQEQLHCDVSTDRLPRGVELTLHLLTECDYESISADGASLPRCLSAVSPSVLVTLPLFNATAYHRKPDPVLLQPAPWLSSSQQASFTNNDSVIVRTALCRFFNVTSSFNPWFHSSGWCDIIGTSYCQWYGLRCNSQGEIIQMNLGHNGLGTPSTLITIDHVMLEMPRLQFLNLSGNWMLQLRSLNISTLQELSTLDLSHAANVWTNQNQELNIPLVLPSACNLVNLNLSYSYYSVQGLPSCTSLQHLSIAGMPYLPFDFGQIALFSNLVKFDAYGTAQLSSSRTLTILQDLSTSNPQIEYLDISATGLGFFADGPGDNFPTVKSHSLRYLAFSGLLQIATAATGPVDSGWLNYLPNLQSLNVSNLPNVFIDTVVFSMASETLQSISAENTAIVGGASLAPITRLMQLQTLVLDSTNIVSTLPPNISYCWPRLTVISIRTCNLMGPLPTFQGLPMLNTILLSQNNLVGDLSPNFAGDSSGLVQVDLSQNALTGSLPLFANHPVLQVLQADSNGFTGLPVPFPFLPSLSIWTCSNNQLAGFLDPELWQKLPNVATIDLSSNMIGASIPSPPNIFAMDLFSVGNNQFVSPMPINIIATVLDLSYNYIFGELLLFSNASVTGEFFLSTLNLESTLGLECPISLSMFSRLGTLNLANAGFTNCDFTNSTLVSLALPFANYLYELDISRNAWLPMTYLVPGSIGVLRASEANVVTVVPGGTDGTSRLVSLTLDGNNIQNPLHLFSSLFEVARNTIRVVSCVECGLNFEITEFFALLHRGLALESLDLSQNALLGRLPPTLFSIAAPTTEIDVGGTGISGSIPPSWNSFNALQRLTVLSTQSQCILQVNSAARLECRPMLGAWIRASSSSMTGFPSTADPTAQARCPAMSIAGSNTSTIAMDPSYHASTLCVCDTGSFGINGRCYACAEGCTCAGDVVQNCFPVLQLGSIAAARMDSNSNRFLATPQSSAVNPFELVVMLPCPRTVTGQSLCNPDGISWAQFYNVTLTSEPSVSAVAVGHAGFGDSSNDVELSGWCYPGHTGRLCAQCSNGYFSSGRWCLKCLSEGVHVVILIANLLVILALIAYLFFKSPKPAASIKALAAYRTRMREVTPPANGPRALLAMSPAADRPYLSISDPTEIAAEDSAEPVSEAANPLKLLIFHSQQLSLLLQTTASMPNVIAGLMSAVSSGSNGFSLSSLVAMECLNAAWSIQHRCWLAIVAPLVIAAFAGLTFLFDRHASSAQLNRAGQLQFSTNDRAQALLAVAEDAEQMSPTDAKPSSPVPRIYGVCVSLLYLLVFPCAQTALSALTCTDTRERTVGGSRVFLNLFPAQQCDDQWSRTILPPALLGALFWLIVFPLCSTLGLRRLQAQLHSASSDSSAAALSAWPICSDLLSPFSPQFWFWEQILLMRRLMLVAVVTIIPSSSLYLPLALFALIQLCALLQHWTHPYTHAMLNAGELVSLYLLLLNYISALILQTGLTEGGFHQTADLWAVLLFLVNFAFLMALGVGLFGFIRKWAVNKLNQRKLQREKAESQVRL